MQNLEFNIQPRISVTCEKTNYQQASDPIHDAFNGARLFGKQCFYIDYKNEGGVGWINRRDYEECGPC